MERAIKQLRASLENGPSSRIAEKAWAVIDLWEETNIQPEKTVDVDIYTLVEGGFHAAQEKEPFEFHGVKYKTPLIALQASKAASHDTNGEFVNGAHKLSETLKIRQEYASMPHDIAQWHGRKVMIKNINIWNSHRDKIMEEIIIAALSLDSPTKCQVNFELAKKKGATRIIHFGPDTHYGLCVSNNGTLQGENLIGEIIGHYYRKWKNDEEGKVKDVTKKNTKRDRPPSEEDDEED